MLHEGVIYRHIILTVPAMFRTSFYQNAAVVLSAFMRGGGQCLDDFYSEVRGKALRGGYITVLHTHGRNGQYHPHLHLLATSANHVIIPFTNLGSEADLLPHWTRVQRRALDSVQLIVCVANI